MIPLFEAAVDGALRRMLARYGAEWTAKWAAVPAADLRSSWRDELTPFAHRLGAIDWALARLPDRAPNAMQFRRLCDQAPRVDAAPESRPGRGPTSEERERLLQLREVVFAGGFFARPGPEWAFRLLARFEAGEPICGAGLRMAREVAAAVEARRAVAAAFLPDAFDAHPSALEVE